MPRILDWCRHCTAVRTSLTRLQVHNQDGFVRSVQAQPV